MTDEQQLIITVRDNAIHQWRTLNEIASDEGVNAGELTKLCTTYLAGEDLSDVLKFNRLPA